MTATKELDPDIQELERVTIRFAGDSGDGMQLTGTQFTRTAAVRVRAARLAASTRNFINTTSLNKIWGGLAALESIATAAAWCIRVAGRTAPDGHVRITAAGLNRH